jgi:hypothetical protein
MVAILRKQLGLPGTLYITFQLCSIQLFKKIVFHQILHVITAKVEYFTLQTIGDV